MADTAVKPFLIAKDEQGQVRLTVRETHRNSRGYPWITHNLVAESFATTAAAKAHAVEHYRAKAGEFATK